MDPVLLLIVIGVAVLLAVGLAGTLRENRHGRHRAGGPVGDDPSRVGGLDTPGSGDGAGAGDGGGGWGGDSGGGSSSY